MRLEFACAPGCRPPSGTRAPLVALARRLEPAQLGVQVVVGRDRMLRRLNREFRGRDRATDVLSFRYTDGEARTPERSSRSRAPRRGSAGAARLPGPDGATAAPDAEVYVSLERAAAQARRAGHTRGQEFVLLVLHGLLHVQGHDHHTPPEARRMRAAEVRTLRWVARRWPGFASRPMLPADPMAAGAE